MSDIDWLGAGSEIKRLLEPLKPGLREVFLGTELADVKNLGQITPAVHILYQGDRIGEGSQSGLATKVGQSWLVVLAYRAIPGQPTAGVWLHRIMSAIAGKPYETGNTTFVRVTPGARPSYSGGVAYLPLAFEVQLKFKGERS